MNDTGMYSSINTRTERTWLLKFGDRVFGWWSSDFRLRKRRCKGCEHEELTIEIPLSDLEDCLVDLRKQLTITTDELVRERVKHVSQDDLDALTVNVRGARNGEVRLTTRTITALVSELAYRRQRQADAGQK